MSLEKFDRICILLTETLNTFSLGKFPEETRKAFAILLSELKNKEGRAAFIDASIQLEEKLKQYLEVLPTYKKDFNKARDPYKAILILFRHSLINIQPYSNSKTMQTLSKVLGLPWP